MDRRPQPGVDTWHAASRLAQPYSCIPARGVRTEEKSARARQTDMQHLGVMNHDTDDQAAAPHADRANAAARAFLSYYADPERRLDYAVLVTGRWGCGKTKLVKDFLATCRAKPLYVSLYGMTAVSQIEDEFFRLLHPVLSHRGMRMAGTLAKGLLRGTLQIDLDGDKRDDGTATIGLPELDVRQGLADPRGRLLVFDDLERCGMPLGEVLGYINAFVEHDGVKAIIIANEEEVLEGDASYLRTKEKLIGQTLQVQPATGEAFDAFVALIGEAPVRQMLIDNRDAVLALHAQGGRGNLRTLKQAMWDFEKVARHLTARHRSNGDAMRRLLSLILAMSMEHRSTTLTADTIRTLVGNRIGRFIGRGHGTPDVVGEIDGRYPQVDFDDAVLTADVLIDVLLRGEDDGDAIRRVIGARREFEVPDEQPLWVRVQSAYLRSDVEVAALAADIDEAFAARTIRRRGELMHLLGIRLWFARIGVIEAAVDDVLRDGLAYIAELGANRDMTPEPVGEIVPGRDDAFGGFRVIESETAEYRALAEAWRGEYERSEEATYLHVALDALLRIESDYEDVLLDTVANDSRSALWCDHPIFSALPPSFFAQCVLTWDPSTQSEALRLLNARHGVGRTARLDTERLWVADVEAALVEALPRLGPMSRHRLGALIDQNLTSLGRVK